MRHSGSGAAAVAARSSSSRSQESVKSNPTPTSAEDGSYEKMGENVDDDVDGGGSVIGIRAATPTHARFRSRSRSHDDEDVDAGDDEGEESGARHLTGTVRRRSRRRSTHSRPTSQERLDDVHMAAAAAPASSSSTAPLTSSLRYPSQHQSRAMTPRYARGHSQEYVSSPAADGDSDGGSGGGPHDVSLSQEHLEREQQRRKRHSRTPRNRSASNSRSSQERLHWRDSKEDVDYPRQNPQSHHRYLTGQPMSRSNEYLDQSHYYYRPRHGQDGLGYEDHTPRQQHWAQRSYERLDHHHNYHPHHPQQPYAGYRDEELRPRDRGYGGSDHRYRRSEEPHPKYPDSGPHRTGRNHVEFGMNTLPKAPRNSQSSQSSSQERRPPSSSHNSSDSSTRYPTLKRSGVQVNFQTPPVVLPPPPPPMQHRDTSYYDTVDSYHHHHHNHQHQHHNRRYHHDVADHEEGIASEASEDLPHPHPLRHHRVAPPPPPVRQQQQQQQQVLSSAAEGSVSDCQSDSNTEPGSAAAPITVEAQVLVNSGGGVGGSGNVILPPPQHGILTNAVPAPPPPPLPPPLEELSKPMIHGKCNSSSREMIDCNEISSLSEVASLPMPMEPIPTKSSLAGVERHNHSMISFQPPPQPPPSTSPSTTTASAGMPSPSVPSSSRTTSHSSSVENVRQGV